MNKIVVSSIEYTEPNIARIYNNPINIENIELISKSFAGYSSGQFYFIEFGFISGRTETWLYPSIKERDKDYNNIITTFATNLGEM